MAKTSSDGENANWVLANTKHCPRCRRAIEKNQGCHHMTCRHEFCWICLGPWSEHGGCYYQCNRYVAHKPENAKEEMRREHANASLDRYMHFYDDTPPGERSAEGFRRGQRRVLKRRSR
jgi:ariadne-1